MLNLSLLKINGYFRAFFSTFQIKDTRGDYLLLVEDQKSELQYMREVQTSDGRKGIVLKIEDPRNAYIALYEPLNTKNLTELSLKQMNIPWQKSVEPIAKHILSKPNNPSLFNIALNKSDQRSEPLIIDTQSSTDIKLHSLSPILQICYSLKYGNFLQFSGCLGSRKTSTLLSMASIFAKKESHISLFLNPSSQSDNKKAIEAGCWGFDAGIPQKQTDVGVYMLTVKIVRLAEILKKQGKDILLAIDGIRHVLQAEWHMMQLLNSNRNKTRQLNFNGPRLPPISILNQISSQCIDNRARGGKGSFSAVLTTQNKSGDQLTPQITPYTNNLKHLDSLAKTINFPLTLKNAPLFKVAPKQQDDDLPSIDFCVLEIRKRVNQYLIEKKQTQLKRRLYKSDMIDAPWDYYKMLDAEWWMSTLQKCSIKQKQQLQNFLFWIWLNIHLQLQAHWKVNCLKAYEEYSKYLQKQNLPIGIKSLQSFTTVARFDGIFSPFKKDYLK